MRRWISIPPADPMDPLWEVVELADRPAPPNQGRSMQDRLRMARTRSQTILFLVATVTLGRAWRLARHSPRGLWVATCWWGRWVSDREGAVACATLAGGDALAAAKHKSAAERHWRQIWWRVAITGVLAGAVALSVPWLPAWTVAVVVPLVALLGLAGRPAHEAEERDPKRAVIGSDEIAQAFTVALPAVTRALRDDPRSLVLRGPVRRDGPGWAATVDLPPGVTVEDAVRARERVASGLRVPSDRLHLTVGDHAGRVDMWVADRRPSEMPAVEWRPTPGATMWDPVRLGTDLKGNPVEVSLIYGSLLIGGLPQYGKTAALRVIQAEAILRGAEVLAFDLKGGGDAIALAPACTVFRAGDSPEDLDALVDALQRLQAYMRGVYEGLRAAGEPKLTRELAARHGGRPVLVSIDECQLAFRDSRVQPLVEDLVRRGPAAGIIVCLSTQRPTADSIPTAVRDNTTIRVCLRVQSQPANDAILGSGAYSSGADATVLGAGDRGIGIVAGDGTDATVTRLTFLPPTQAAAIAAQHARQDGPGADRYEGAGPGRDEDAGSVIDHILAVWPSGRDRATCAELAAGLAAARGEYAGWTAADVGRALAAHGLSTRTIRVGQSTAKGVYRADFDGQRATA